MNGDAAALTWAATIGRPLTRIWATLVVIAGAGTAIWISTGRPWALVALFSVFVFGIGAAELAARLRRS